MQAKKTNVKKSMEKAFKLYGKAKLADALGRRYQSLDRWMLTGKMPLTEFNGDTAYSMTIEKLTEGKVTVEDLLGWVPVTQTAEWQGPRK